MKKNYEQLLSSFKDNIASYEEYNNFEKVYENIAKYKKELSLINTLVGSNDIKNDFITLIKKYPECLKVVPLLLAIRKTEIKINDANIDYIFNFNKISYPLELYALFMEKCGLFNLLSKRLINNIYDYIIGIEVGLDSNSRKNRIGTTMENIVESYLQKAGLKKGVTYFKEMYANEIEDRFNIDLSNLTKSGKTNKRFDFVIYYNSQVYSIECNFYSSQGSKLNETARSYKDLALSSKNIQGFKFIWITDGMGWHNCKTNLKDTYEVMDHLFNLNDLENNILLKLLNNI